MEGRGFREAAKKEKAARIPSGKLTEGRLKRAIGN
jgi:hypothetical protein